MFTSRIFNRVFAQGEPTVFIISSPFQLLCAYNAIKSFGIIQYKIVFVLFPNVIRNEQMFIMAKDMNIRYELIYTDSFNFEDFFQRRGIFSVQKGYYKRAFLGSYFRPDFRMIASLYLSNGLIAFMDDGTSTLSLFRDGYFSSDHPKPSSFLPKIKWYKNIWLKEYKLDYKIRKQLALETNKITNCFYTIYDNVKTYKFRIYLNSLSHILDINEIQACNNIIIVGSFIRRDAEWNELSETSYMHILSSKLKKVRDLFPSEQILYIPHGSDTNEDIQSICHSTSIQYMRIDIAIEYWFIQNHCKPQAIYGFGSTALLNIKRMFPDISVTDWFIDKPDSNPYYNFYKMIADYYSKNDIVIERTIF